jgi:hypothetical protein
MHPCILLLLHTLHRHLCILIGILEAQGIIPERMVEAGVEDRVANGREVPSGGEVLGAKQVWTRFHETLGATKLWELC